MLWTAAMRGSDGRSPGGGLAAPLVSILLPARDAAATLPACLRSIRRQTLADWECVLVDDGSRDATAAVAYAAAAGDRRIRVVTTAQRGLVRALNDGLAHCRGAFVARMDADDLMHRARLAEQVRMLAADPPLTAVGAHVRLFPRARLRAGLRRYERWLNAIDSPQRVHEEAFVECPVAHPTLLIRRAVLAAFGYRDRGWPEDYDLVLRLLAAGRTIGVVPRRLLAWREAPTRLSRTSGAYALARFTACKAAFLASGFLAHADAYVLCGYGATGKALLRALATHGKRPSHLVELHPGRIGEVIHGARVIPPDALPSVPRRPIVVSVAHAAPRREARATLARMGFRELQDFVCAA
jgi:cellulose synthase/poly-beta-1,6-N-acetylglucosamine synthase-like glycosyltransferase